jgi:hypothetical protein
LVAQGYSQVEWLDFDKTFALIARLEAIRILLAYATPHNIKLYQINMKSAFLNGKINKLVYVEQPPDFEDSKRLNQVYKFSKALYDLGDMMSWEFKMSMIDELSFFLSLQVKQTKDETFICQSKYMNDLLKRFDMDNSKSIKSPMATNAHHEGGNPVDLKLYRSMVDRMLYLTISRSDIMFIICICARFQASSKECHMMVIKQILRYLRQILNLGL